MSLKDKIYKKIGERDFENSRPITFVYCEVNEDYVIVPKPHYATAHVLPGRGHLMDQITEGVEMILPHHSEEYIESELDRVFEQIQRISEEINDGRGLYRSHLYLYYNHGTKAYSLLLMPVFYGKVTKELEADLTKITKQLQEETSNG